MLEKIGKFILKVLNFLAIFFEPGPEPMVGQFWYIDHVGVVEIVKTKDMFGKLTRVCYELENGNYNWVPVEVFRRNATLHISTDPLS